MNDSEIKIDQHLFQLVLSLQMAAMQNMGKIMSPVTGKIERNLEQARISIDMLGMVSEKTKGNLNDEEDKFLTNILHELRLNYTDEASKPDPQPEEESKDGEESKIDSESETPKSDDPESENNGDTKE
ncbi:MAG: DUF1844 domain-containing protein [candidate division Zixibacteria bacterium]|nr:DUF1844 domain-containing protein [candidate division Zixibacteria bacterium]